MRELDRKVVGAAITRARENAGMTIFALADAAAVDVRVVESYERGETTASPGFRRILDVLGISPTELFGD